MKLITYYQTGKIDVFDTATFTATDPFKRDGMNLITEFAIRFDLLEDKNSNEGLVVDVYWYDAKIHDKDNAVTSLDEKKNATLNNALLKASTRIRLISKRELEDVAKITLDGELVEWRQGGELVNGVKFFSQELLYFSNGRSASITERACKISQFIKNANPELPDEIIAGWMGLPPTVL